MIDIMENKVLGPALQAKYDQGKAEGERKLVIRFLTKKFGILPQVVLDRLNHASEAELFQLIDCAITATTLDEILRYG